MEHNDLGEPNRENEPIEYGEDAAGQPTTLTLDTGKYEHFFEDEDMTDEQKREYLETLWNIVVSFIQIGVEVRPASNNCGKPAVSADCWDNDSAGVVESELQNLNNTFTTATDRASGPQQGGDRNEQ